MERNGIIQRKLALLDKYLTQLQSELGDVDIERFKDNWTLQRMTERVLQVMVKVVVDIAVFIDGKPTLELYEKVYDIVESIVPGVDCDIGILNNAEPVYRFEALKGKLLFFRDQEQYLHFFSLTCREYESQMADYQRQKRYRLMKI